MTARQPRHRRILTISQWGQRTAAQLRPQLTFTGKTGADYARWREQFEARYAEMLGRFPDPVPLRAELLERRRFPTYIREKVIFDSERFMSVPAWVCLPRARRRNERCPAVLCCHGHGPGKDGFVGLNPNGKSRMRYDKNLAIRLAERGFVTIAPDWRGFGERNEPPETHPAPRDLCNVGHLTAEFLGYNLLALDVWDGMKTIDYLATRPEVDLSRLGCVGVSFGGTMTLFLSAADPRITAACVSGYLLPTKEHIFNSCGSQTLPGLLRWGDRAEVGGLICPRPLLIQMGEYDSSFPPSAALPEYRRLARLSRAAGAAGAAGRLGLDLFDGCHEIHAAAILEWFDRWLKP